MERAETLKVAHRIVVNDGSAAARLILFALLLIVFAVLPHFVSDAIVVAVGRALIAVIFALAFNLLAGQAGMLSFGHAAYSAIGAFATVHAMIAIEHGAIAVPSPLVPLFGAGAGLLAGLVAGYFATMRSGVYFAMVTLAISELLYTIAPNLEGVFGGEIGLSSFRQPFLNISFGTETQVYYLVLAWAVVAMLLMFAYTQSLFGRLALACRENEKRLPALGFNTHRTKTVIFGISGLFSGLAGGLLAFSTESANYALLDSSASAAVVLQTYIGGSGLFLGPAFGAFFITLFGYVVSDITRSWLFYQGLLFIAVMLLAPRGLAKWVADEGGRLMHGGANALARLVLLIIAICLAALAIVHLAEIGSVLLSRDYIAAAARTGTYEPIRLFGVGWAPKSPLTWALPLVFLAGSIGLARVVKRWKEVSR